MAVSVEIAETPRRNLSQRISFSCTISRMESENKAWDHLTYRQKNHRLFLEQKETLDRFLETGAITKAQHDKSLRDLKEKMGEA